MITALFRRWSTFNEMELALHGIFFLCSVPVFLWVISGWLIEGVQTDIFGGIFRILLLSIFLHTLVKGAVQAVKLPLTIHPGGAFQIINKKALMTLKVFVGAYFGVVTVLLAIYTMYQIENNTFHPLVSLGVGIFIMFYMLVTILRTFYLFIVAREGLSVQVTDVHFHPKLYSVCIPLFAVSTYVLFFTVQNIVLVFIIPFTIIGIISVLIPKGGTFQL